MASLGNTREGTMEGNDKELKGRRELGQVKDYAVRIPWTTYFVLKKEYEAEER